jgi:hypothetical protein
MAALIAVATPTVFICTVVEEAPPGIVTIDEAGDAALLLDANVTAIPPAGAGPDRVAVPVLELPPETLVGFRMKVDRVGALMLSVAVWLLEPAVPVIVTASDFATAFVMTVNVAVVEPDGIVTLAGVPASELLDDRFTTAPELPAGPEIVTLPVLEVPPVTEFGATERLTTWNGLMLSVPPREPPLMVAVNITAWGEVADCVLIVNVADWFPEGTDTVAGKLTPDPFEPMATKAPPAEAFAFSVRVADAEAPLVTVLG